MKVDGKFPSQCMFPFSITCVLLSLDMSMSSVKLRPFVLSAFTWGPNTERGLLQNYRVRFDTTLDIVSPDEFVKVRESLQGIFGCRNSWSLDVMVQGSAQKES